MRIGRLSYPNPMVAHRGGKPACHLVVCGRPGLLGIPKLTRINGIDSIMPLQPEGFDC
jgi:hypothetical protein